MAVEAPRAGRPQSVSTEEMLAEARRQVSEVGVSEFSVRELAKALSLVPGTIHARFGNKQELLAVLYLQRISQAAEMLASLPDKALADVSALLEATSPDLSLLRREFVLHFEGNGKARPRLHTATWDALKVSFRGLSDRLYESFRDAAANEGVTVVGGTQAKRFLWTLASTMDSQRSAVAFDHADANYRRFVARSLLSALAAAR
ncbi:MAG TPA: helix-turn-helix domain-containing protein [Frankiaceae bacterium]|nr:helix-turn-helix domain-containing protein [Frankiaceae bacterium]